MTDFEEQLIYNGLRATGHDHEYSVRIMDKYVKQKATKVIEKVVGGDRERLLQNNEMIPAIGAHKLIKRLKKEINNV